MSPNFPVVHQWRDLGKLVGVFVYLFVCLSVFVLSQKFVLSSANRTWQSLVFPHANFLSSILNRIVVFRNSKAPTFWLMCIFFLLCLKTFPHIGPMQWLLETYLTLSTKIHLKSKKVMTNLKMETKWSKQWKWPGPCLWQVPVCSLRVNPKSALEHQQKVL